MRDDADVAHWSHISKSDIFQSLNSLNPRAFVPALLVVYLFYNS